MRKYLRFPLLVLCALSWSCIGNTIPYPVVTLQILNVEGKGFTFSAADIDSENRVVKLRLDEQTDPSRVEIEKISVTEGAGSSSPLSGVFDLRTPYYITLSLYQEYEWTIVAEQHIERYFDVESQIGSATIDAAQRTATAYVSAGTDLSAIKVTRLKLGPADITTMTPPIEELTSFTEEVEGGGGLRYVHIAYHDIKERWALYVIPTDTKIRFTQLDAWSGVIWAYAEGNSDAELGFRYRTAGAEEWSEVAKEALTVSGGAFHTCITGLAPETEYELLAYSGEDETEIATVATGPMTLLPNGGFEEWATINNIVCPYLEESTAFWGTGNTGARVGGVIPTNSTTDIRPGSSGHYAAKLESKAVLGSILAAGNLFTGRFCAVRNGTNGVVGFGQPFEQRPTALRGWFKYNQGELNIVKTQPPGLDLQKGDPDNGMIYIALGTWTPEKYGESGGEMFGTPETPIAIDTRNTGSFFDPSGPDVIAYGEMPLTSTVAQWQEFTIPLKYTATDRKPTHIIVVCTASRWGDYFTGSSSSVLWVDDFELIYDRLE
ncbi:MAG: PCMD domain-containing protein [Alistipes sp.]|nr:PCMD domain-containing protein [Alistipes sp.]